MDTQGQFTATLIDSGAKALAAGAITRLSEAGGREVEAWGFQQLVRDAQARLQSLGEALAAGRPELLRLDIEWLATTYREREVPTELLDKTLACLREELADRLPKDAATMAVSYLEAAQGWVVDAPSQAPSLLVDGQPHEVLARRFLLAVLEGRRVEAERLVLDAFDGGVSLSDLHEYVLATVQAEIGRLWQVGDAHIAEEHLASRIVEETLILLRARMPRAAENGRSVLVASVRGNMHDIGARSVADHFEMGGWRALFLGADTPTADLVAAVGHFNVHLAALSAGLGLNVRATAELVAELHEKHPNVPVLVGGRPFSYLPDLWKTVGADGSATDAPGAVVEGDRLMAR